VEAISWSAGFPFSALFVGSTTIAITVHRRGGIAAASPRTSPLSPLSFEARSRWQSCRAQNVFNCAASFVGGQRRVNSSSGVGCCCGVACPRGQGSPRINSQVICRRIPCLDTRNSLHQCIRRVGSSVEWNFSSDFMAPPRGEGIRGHSARGSRA
jgi:hypothetical protein